MVRLRNLLPFIFGALLSSPLSTMAEGFGIDVTRLIYPQGAASIAVSVRNTQTTQPYLVQATISPKADQRQGKSPFSLTPPLFRLEPSSTHQIRIHGNTSSLPVDRESVFYFHATAIPASKGVDNQQPVTGVKGNVQFGVGNIIKLFYRPSGLTSSSVDAQKGLRISRNGQGLLVENPSPYFVSLASLSVAGQDVKLNTPDALMIAPFGSHTYPVSVTRGVVSWKTITDQGGRNAFTYTLP